MFKRTFDFVLALLAIIGLSPLFVLTYILVYVLLGSPVIFVQKRPGLGGKPFKMLKFRSMTDEKGADGELLSDAHRLTAFGRFLRASSLDELPGLFNVVLGHLSLVGPRPLLMEYLPLYDERQAKRHNVRPGITGWAQVNGRNALSWQDKFDLDVWYVENQSFWLDLKILFLTVLTVVRRQGINQEGQATMTRFTGNNQSDA